MALLDYKTASSRLVRALPALIFVALVLALATYILPERLRSPLWETAAWAILVIVGFAGWGSLVHFVVAPREPLDLGLRTAWGAAFVGFIGGALMPFSLMTRGAALGLVEIGAILAMVSLVRERAAVRRETRFALRVAKREPRLAVVAGIVVFVIAIHFLSGIADWHTNPYDDDIAYLALVKKLRDTGNLLEPFSFRRLSALGGQTLFLELVSVHANPSQSHTFDRSICVVLITMLVSGYRARRRRLSVLFVLSTVMLLVTLPNIAINTASYYSGVVFFLALFRTMTWLGDQRRSAWRAAVPLALLSAAACTLRQNYLPVPVVILAVSYAFRLRYADEQWTKRLAEPLFTAAFSLIALVPWFVTSWQSSRTFLYPLVLGTFNPALQLRASGMNIYRELWFQVWTALEGLPLKPLGLFVLAAAFVRERASRRPLWSLALGSAVGFSMVAHEFTQSDAASLARYTFAFLVAFAIAVLLVAGTTRLGPRIDRNHAAVGIALFAALTQLVLSRGELFKFYTTAFHNVEELHYARPRTSENASVEFHLYNHLQASVPAGERIAVLVDEPFYLDFARNPIWNLDMPGYASLPPGMPFFKGSARLAEYFRSIGVRYLAFVQPQYSRYHYRREYWIELLTSEQEVWRAFTPYLLDFMDSLTDLEKKHLTLFVERGIVVLDLAAARENP